jgi:hypothetical protein
LTIKKPQTTSLIDTLSEGFAAINRRPWLVLLPILINLYIWFGTQLSFAPLLTDLSAIMRMNVGSAEQANPPTQPADLLRSLGQIDMRQELARLNFIPTLTMYRIITANSDQQPEPAAVVAGLLTMYRIITADAHGRPISFLFVQEVPQPIAPDYGDAIRVYNVGGLLLALVLINGLALPLSAVFLTQVAAAVRGDRAALGTGLQRAWRTMLAILGWVGVVLGVAVALELPFMCLFVLLLYFSQPLGLFMSGILIILGFWIRIYLGFANEAIAVSGVGPLRALHASFNIVRRNFWGTLGLLALSWLISVGAGVLWLNLAQDSTAGLLVAIGVSAYLGSGLLAARMAFYRERLRRWQSAAAPVRTT